MLRWNGYAIVFRSPFFSPPFAAAVVVVIFFFVWNQFNQQKIEEVEDKQHLQRGLCGASIFMLDLVRYVLLFVMDFYIGTTETVPIDAINYS